MKRTHQQFKRILIANRGEIAVRIMRTAKEMGIETVAIYTHAEKEALHVEKADIKALMIGSSLNDTYLNAAQIIQLAQQYKADAIHPGYGFLSENEAFAHQCTQHNIAFIGPSAKQIRLMGNKEEANQIAASCNIPLLKKVNGTVADMLDNAQSLQLPLLIKAAAGGGGKGMRIIRDLSHLKAEIKRASEEAERYFGNPAVYIEEYIENPRHIEVQILADEHGNTIHLHERDCSIQRRHQKVVEECPAPNLNPETKKQIVDDALTLAKHINYTNAGTVEFLLTPDGKHYFLEMNTRIQVEHPVTEEVTGIDIVKEQINIASGIPLSYSQHDIKICGHAIEARIYAENPKDNFTPSFGKIMGTHIPSHPNVRIDGGAQAEENLNPDFDPLLKKVIAHGTNRQQAIDHMENFLANYALFGVESNREFILKTLTDEDFQKGTYSTSFFKTKKDDLLKKNALNKAETKVIAATFVVLKNNIKANSSSIWNSLGYWRTLQKHQIRFDEYKINIDVKQISSTSITMQIDALNVIEISNINIEQNELSFIIDEELYKVNFLISTDGLFHIQYDGIKRVICDKPERLKRIDQDNSLESIKTLKAPMPGRIIDILVKEGELIKRGHPLMVLEAMKTENSINAWKDTTITKISVIKGEQVGLNQVLIETD